MVKLSKTGWNNVIIFAVMGFILVINLTNKKIFSADDNVSSEQEIALVGKQNVIPVSYTHLTLPTIYSV